MDLTKLHAMVNGKKTYIALAVGALAIAINHLGFWPNTLIPLNLDPANWLNDEYTLIIGATMRSAVAKVKP